MDRYRVRATIILAMHLLTLLGWGIAFGLIVGGVYSGKDYLIVTAALVPTPFLFFVNVWMVFDYHRRYAP